MKAILFTYLVISRAKYLVLQPSLILTSTGKGYFKRAVCANPNQ